MRAMASTPVELFKLNALLSVLRRQQNHSTKPLLWMDLGQPERLYVLELVFCITILVVLTSWLQTMAMETPDAGGDASVAATTNSMNLMMPYSWVI